LNPKQGSHRAFTLDAPEVFGLEAFGTFHDIELDRLTFSSERNTSLLMAEMMHERVFAFGAAKEAKSHRIVKQFHRSLFQSYSFVADVSLNSRGMVASREGRQNGRECQIGFGDQSLSCTAKVNSMPAASSHL